MERPGKYSRILLKIGGTVGVITQEQKDSGKKFLRVWRK